MDKKNRSRGVTILGWLMILINILLLLGALDAKSFFNFYNFFQNNLVIALYSYSLISAILGAIAGIGVLKLKESMRKLALFINYLDVLEGIPFFFFSIKGLQQSCYKLALSGTHRITSQGTINLVANITFYMTAIFIWLIIGLSILNIYFFTRPKVKEQFK
ncbi:MAG: hypothetical protein PHQ96_05960 [Candidatus Omnitrophica bacterium]|nr:hypothetical protein [Candidatus Omnitrophota bacterium]